MILKTVVTYTKFVELRGEKVDQGGRRRRREKGEEEKRENVIKVMLKMTVNPS